MKKSILLSFLFFLFFQFSFCQDTAEKKYKEAVEKYKQDDFTSANLIIKEIKPLYKTVPPKVLYLEIMTKYAIIKNNPLDNYTIILETRNLVSKYLKNNVKYKNDNYAKVKNVSEELNAYPKNEASFNYIKAEENARIEREKQLEAEAKVKAEKDAEIRAVNEAATAKRNAEIRAVNEAAAIETAKNKEKADKIAREEAEKQALIKAKKEAEYYKGLSFRRGFASLGVQSGEIAKYGLIYERGGIRTVGFHISARTSNTSEEEILNGSSVENKTEVDLGPNFKIFNRFYFNIGAGYGYYDKVIRNDYAGTSSLEKTGYLLATSGVMVRISRVININGGVSFMDVDKAFYKPEITFGVSFNLKKK